MQFVPTVEGELVPIGDIERIRRTTTPPGENRRGWECQTRDGRTHRLSGPTVTLLSSSVVPAAPGWFIPEELIGGQTGREHLIGLSKVPIVAWLVPATGRGIAPLTIDPDLSGAEQPLGTPDGRVLLADGSEFDSLDQYLQHLQHHRPPRS